MSANIQAPKYTNSLEFTGYDGTAMDICAKMTSLMGLHEKIRLILDSYVDPKTKLYKMEAIYPGLLPPGTVMAYYPTAKTEADMRREVWQLQRTPDDLEGINVLEEDDLKKGAIWTICDGGTAGGILSRDLRGRFIASYLSVEDVADPLVGKERGAKEIGKAGGADSVVLTPAQGGMVNHTHLLGHYGPVPGEPDMDQADATFHKVTPAVAGNSETGWRVESGSTAQQVSGTISDYGIRTSGIHEPANTPGPIYDPTTGRNTAIETAAHENLPPYYTLVYIQRTARSDSNFNPDL